MSVATPSRRLSLTWLLAAGWLLAASIAQAKAPDEAQRATFKQAYAAARQGGDGWRQQAAGLRDYPLYPYLQAAALEHDIRQLDRAAVEAYLKQYLQFQPFGVDHRLQVSQPLVGPDRVVSLGEAKAGVGIIRRDDF